MIRSRTISSVEVLDAHPRQIANHNSKLNAICTLDEERARQHAIKADKALARGENSAYLSQLKMRLKPLDSAPLRATNCSKITFLKKTQKQ
nr:hypothetical protein [Microseira wollei]